jgi:methyl-accepting chemotaxis protein
MSLEITIGIIIILGVAVWGFIQIKNATTENVNEHLFDFIPHLFPTLGILFTFIGIAFGLWNFDSNNIEKSIPELMNGLKTAFIVSIFGVALLVIFSLWTNIKKKKLEEGVLSEETQAINKLIEAIQALREDFSAMDHHGNRIKPGNLFRDIYNESVKQSNSLQTFSSDLATTISAGFEEILNNPSAGVVAELKLVKAEIENLGNKLNDPATDMTQNIVKDLQSSMGKMIEDFKTSMSGETKDEMERLAQMLGQAGGSLADFPSKLQHMTDNLNENFSGLQDVIKHIAQQTISQSEHTTLEMRKQVEEMGETLRNKVGDLQSGQQTLLIEQSKNLQVSEQLLNSFNTSIEKMNESTNGVSQTIQKFKSAQNEMEFVISAFKTVSQELSSSSNKLGDSQNNFARYSNEFLQKNEHTITEIQNALTKAKDVSADYAQKFGVIENGLQEIFMKIATGLKGYQDTVGGSLEIYLNKYSEALTQTAESLVNAATKQEDILEELTEQLSKLNAKK